MSRHPSGCHPGSLRGSALPARISPGIPASRPGSAQGGRSSRASAWSANTRTDEVLAALGELLRQRPDTAMRAQALEFAFALYPDLTDKLRKDLGRLPFAVPGASGQWVSADHATFSAGWETPGGRLLEQLLPFATDETPGLLALRERLLAEPGPVAGTDQLTGAAGRPSFGQSESRTGFRSTGPLCSPVTGFNLTASALSTELGARPGAFPGVAAGRQDPLERRKPPGYPVLVLRTHRGAPRRSRC